MYIEFCHIISIAYFFVFRDSIYSKYMYISDFGGECKDSAGECLDSDGDSEIEYDTDIFKTDLEDGHTASVQSEEGGRQTDVVKSVVEDDQTGDVLSAVKADGQTDIVTSEVQDGQTNTVKSEVEYGQSKAVDESVYPINVLFGNVLPKGKVVVIHATNALNINTARKKSSRITTTLNPSSALEKDLVSSFYRKYL